MLIVTKYWKYTARNTSMRPDGHLETKQLDQVLSRLAAHFGVNFLEFPCFRECLELLEFQELRLDEIYEAGKKQWQRLEKEWSELLRAELSKSELKNLQKRVREFELQTEQDLFSALGDQRKRIERLFTDNARIELSAPDGFEIPAGYEAR